MIKEITAKELSTKRFIEEKVKEIQGRWATAWAINALSGGVDSSTVTLLGHRRWASASRRSSSKTA